MSEVKKGLSFEEVSGSPHKLESGKEGSFQVGQSVVVRRSNGEAEVDWIVTRIDESKGEVEVKKYLKVHVSKTGTRLADALAKVVKIEDLKSWQIETKE